MTRGIITDSLSENSPQKRPTRPTKRPTKKGKICRCGLKLISAVKRCRKCEAKYRRDKRAEAKAKAEEITIDVAINIVAHPNKTYGVLVTTTRPLEGDEATRAKLYGPFTSRKEAQAKAALVDQALEVWGFANGW